MKIVFFKAKNGTWIDKFIAIWTGFGPYSHCFILDEDIEYSASGFEKGVYRKKFINPIEFCDFIDLEEINQKLTTTTNPNYDFLYKFYNLTKDIKYDWVGIFLKFFFNKHNFNDKYYCSEWCGNVLQGIFNNQLKFLYIHGSPNRLYKQLSKFLKNK